MMATFLPREVSGWPNLSTIDAVLALCHTRATCRRVAVVMGCETHSLELQRSLLSDTCSRVEERRRNSGGLKKGDDKISNRNGLPGPTISGDILVMDFAQAVERH